MLDFSRITIACNSIIACNIALSPLYRMQSAQLTTHNAATVTSLKSEHMMYVYIQEHNNTVTCAGAVIAINHRGWGCCSHWMCHSNFQSAVSCDARRCSLSDSCYCCCTCCCCCCCCCAYWRRSCVPRSRIHTVSCYHIDRSGRQRKICNVTKVATVKSIDDDVCSS